MVTRTPLIWASTVSVGLAALALVSTQFVASSYQFLALFALAVVFGVVAVTFATVAIAVGITRTVALTADSILERQGERLTRWAIDLEETNELARSVNLADLVVPLDRRPAEERAARALEDAKLRYVDGALTDAEFEWELARILDLEERGTDRRPLEGRRY